MTRRITTAIALALAAVLVLGALGCGTGTSSDTGDTNIEEATTVASGPVATADLLTPADVERVSGLTGLAVVPYDPSIGAGGDINIAGDSGQQLVAMLIDEGPETWDLWLTDGLTVGEPVSPPVGDESFIGPNPDVSETPYIFGFRKGDRAIVIDTFFETGTSKTVLTIDQLRQLAELVESRL